MSKSSKAIIGNCQNCGQRPATQQWIGEQSLMDVAHGGMVYFWCEHCTLEAQLKFAQRVADTIPDLTKRLAELKRAGG